MHVKSIYVLAHLAEKGDAKAAAALLETAKTSSSAADRCQAAILLPDKQTAKQIIGDSIFEAYSQKDLGKSYSSATWITWLDDAVRLLDLLELVDASCGIALSVGPLGIGICCVPSACCHAIIVK